MLMKPQKAGARSEWARTHAQILLVLQFLKTRIQQKYMINSKANIFIEAYWYVWVCILQQL